MPDPGELTNGTYRDLAVLARRMRGAELNHISIDTGDLLNEAVMALDAQGKRSDKMDGPQFRSHLCRQMRTMLINRARRRGLRLRYLELRRAESPGAVLQAIDILIMGEVLDEAGRGRDPEAVRAFELHHFLGRPKTEIAADIGTSPRNIERWIRAITAKIEVLTSADQDSQG